MNTGDVASSALQKYLREHLVSTMPELQQQVQSGSRMSVFRTLKALGYFSSYSHRGRYYTLAETPCFDENGLWFCKGARFSCHGSLLATVQVLVEHSPSGLRVAELDDLLGVETKHALLKLYREQRLARENLAGRYLYLSIEAGKRRQQFAMRESSDAAAELGAGIDMEVMPEELKAAILLFFSLLDEQQRRLYAGLEAAKLGHGGDRKLASLLGLDPHTVAKGRQQLFTGDVRRDRIRREGGGDILLEEKRHRTRRKSPRDSVELD